MSPKRDVSEERKAQILKAASAVFAKKGFAEARMDDVAEEAGLSKGTLYLYYKSKDDLIAGLMVSTFREQMQGLYFLLEAEGTVRERLMTIAQMLPIAIQQSTDWLAISFEVYAVAGRQASVRAFLKDYYAEYQAAMARLFQQGIDRGEFPPFDTNQTAIALIALLEGLFLLWIIDPEAVPVAQVMPNAVRFMLDGLVVSQNLEEGGKESDDKQTGNE